MRSPPWLLSNVGYCALIEAFPALYFGAAADTLALLRGKHKSIAVRRVRLRQNDPKSVVSQLLEDRAVGRVSQQSHRAEYISWALVLLFLYHRARFGRPPHPLTARCRGEKEATQSPGEGGLQKPYGHLAFVEVPYDTPLQGFIGAISKWSLQPTSFQFGCS